MILADMSRKAILQTQNFVVKLLNKRMKPEDAESLGKMLTKGTWTHDYPITAEEATQFGLPINTDIENQVCDIMALYPQNNANRTSVQYIPLPYKSGKEA